MPDLLRVREGDACPVSACPREDIATVDQDSERFGSFLGAGVQNETDRAVTGEPCRSEVVRDEKTGSVPLDGLIDALIGASDQIAERSEGFSEGSIQGGEVGLGFLTGHGPILPLKGRR